MTIWVDDKAVKRRMQQREASKRYREKHPDRLRESWKKQNDKPEQKERRKKWLAGKTAAEYFEKNKEHIAAQRRDNYKTRNDAQLVAATGSTRPETCQVCGQGGKIVFDHDHAAAKFRGWLCTRCNLVLGHVKDDPELLKKLTEYLEASLGNVCR